LVVEDEVLIRMPISAYLRECGYQVFKVNADEAMTVLRERDIAIDIILANAELPGALDGFSLARWVRENRSEIRTLLAGAPSKVAPVAGDLCEEGPLLPRPYHHTSVERLIRRLLAAKPVAKS
jgi:CheY-like chemotaxis protein